MSYVCFFIPETHGADEALVFYGAAGEVWSHWVRDGTLVHALAPGVGMYIPNVGFVIILFHAFFAVFLPVFTTLNISSSLIPFTLGSGTLNFAACEVDHQPLHISSSKRGFGHTFSFLLFLIALLSAFAFVG